MTVGQTHRPPLVETVHKSYQFLAIKWHSWELVRREMRCDKKYSGDATLMRSHFTREINIGIIMFGAERSTLGPSGVLSEKIKVPGTCGTKWHGKALVAYRPRGPETGWKHQFSLEMLKLCGDVFEIITAYHLITSKMSDRIQNRSPICSPNAISITAPSSHFYRSISSEGNG